MKPSFSPDKPETAEISQIPGKLLIQAFARLDRMALGIAVGTVLGLTIFAATNFLIIKGRYPVGPNLALLGQYFIGYSVTVKGSFVGFIYGFLSGFVLGWVTAFLRNLFIAIYIHFVKLKADLASLDEFIDHL